MGSVLADLSPENGTRDSVNPYPIDLLPENRSAEWANPYLSGSHRWPAPCSSRPIKGSATNIASTRTFRYWYRRRDYS
jgi:hypothetical protein